MDIEKQTKELNKQLYPTGRAWGFVHGSEQVDTQVVRFVDGLGNPFVDGYGNQFISTYGSEASPSKRLINAFLKSFERLFTDSYSLLNQTLADNDDFDETDASNWERIYFGIAQTQLTLEERKAQILRKQYYPAGVAERGNYLLIQDELQAAGFYVYVHENRFPDGSGGWTTESPSSSIYGISIYGNAVYGATGSVSGGSIVANHIEESIDDDFIIGTGDSEKAIFFISTQTLGGFVDIPTERKTEFRELVLKLKPAQTVAYALINYI